MDLNFFYQAFISEIKNYMGQIKCPVNTKALKTDKDTNISIQCDIAGLKI